MCFLIALFINVMRWLIIFIRLFEIKNRDTSNISKLNKLTMVTIISLLTTLIPGSLIIWCTNRDDTSATEKEVLGEIFGILILIAHIIVFVLSISLQCILRNVLKRHYSRLYQAVRLQLYVFYLTTMCIVMLRVFVMLYYSVDHFDDGVEEPYLWLVIILYVSEIVPIWAFCFFAF